MMNNVLENIVSEEKTHIRSSDIDFDKSLKPFALLNFFQDIASDNAERLGFGYSNIYPKNLMWVLLKYRIEFYNYPVDIQDLIIRTEPRGYNKLFAYRNFEVQSGDNIIARASSMWSLVDISTLSIAKIEPNIDSPYFIKHEKNERDLDFEKIPQLERVDYEKEFEVRYNDIDVNMHANNGNYIIWALEPLPKDFRLKHKLKNIDMMFKKEIKIGEKLISDVQIKNNKTIHKLIHSENGNELCVLNCEWV